MTYKEIKDRLSKCELTLEKIKSGKITDLKPAALKKKTAQLEVLRESYIKQLKEAQEKTYLVTPKSGKTAALSLGDDEVDALKDADDIDKIKSSDGTEVKEQEGVKFSVDETKAIAKSVGKAVAMSLKSLGDSVSSMKAKNIEESSFEIYVQYKNGSDDQFSFYIVEDKLHLQDFSFDKELVDVGVKPSGEAIVNVDVLSNELQKHFKSLNEDEEEDAKNDADYERGWTDDPRMDEAPKNMYYFKVPKTDKAKLNAAQNTIETFYDPVRFADIVDDDGAGNVVMYIHKKDFDPGMIDDLQGDGIDLSSSNFPTGEASDYNEAQATSVQDVIDPADYGVIGQNYLAGFNRPHSLDADELEMLGRKIVKQLYKGDFKAAMAKHGGTNVNETEVDTAGADLDVGHQDDEPNMLKKDLYDVITYASKLYKALDKYDQHDGEVDFPHWWQKKVTLAREYMSAAQHYLEGEEKQPAIDQLALEGKEELKEWGSSDQNIMNQSIHKELGEPKSMPSPFSQELESAAEDAVDHYWDDWEEYETDREGLVEHAKKAYLRAYFKETFNKMVQMFSESMNEEMDENRFLAASMEDLEQVIRNLAHTGEMSEDEAIELAIKKLEAMLDGRDDMDESVNEGTELYDRNGIQIKRFSGGQKGVMVQITIGDKYIVVPAGEYPFLVRAMQSVQGDLKDMTRQYPRSKNMEEGFGKTKKAYDLVVSKMKELAKVYKSGDHSVVDQLKDLTAKKKKLEAMLDNEAGGIGASQQLDPNVNEYRGVGDDLIKIIKDKAEDSGFSHEEEIEEIIEFLQGIEFDDNGNIDAVYEEYKGKHQGTNYKWPMSKATKDRKEADKKKTVKEEKATYCGRCKTTHKKSSGCPK